MIHDIMLAAVRRPMKDGRDAAVVVYCRSCIQNNANKTSTFMELAMAPTFTTDELNIIISAHDYERQMAKAVLPHEYSPDFQAMGDCQICGRLKEDHV